MAGRPGVFTCEAWSSAVLLQLPEAIRLQVRVLTSVGIPFDIDKPTAVKTTEPDEMMSKFGWFLTHLDITNKYIDSTLMHSSAGNYECEHIKNILQSF